jgi:Rrf2 family iron-sulfur cluster assembly transcriptional regulator
MNLVRVSSKGDYACRALLSLTLHAEQPGPISVRDIAERTGIPQPYLEQILLALKGAGLVRSKRGVGGGYVLARPPEEIRLSEVLAAVDGPISLGDFGDPHQDGSCDHEGQCVPVRDLEARRRPHAPAARRLHRSRRSRRSLRAGSVARADPARPLSPSRRLVHGMVTGRGARQRQRRRRSNRS